VDGFVNFMQSLTGRLLRVVAGSILLAVGIWIVGGPWGLVPAVLGAVPLIAGTAGICLLAPFFGYTFQGQKTRRPNLTHS
jgi:hypothetical protein